MERAVIYYKDFLRRVQDYSINSTTDNTTGQVVVDGKVSKELADMATSRADKIARFKAKKSLEQRLKELDKSKHVDDATMREYTITTVQLWITRCVDELNSTKQELGMLEYMESRQGAPPPVTSPPSAPFKPITITRDMIQKKVFGAGYPSLPTMSVEEWHEKRIRDGVIPPDQVHVEERDMSKWVGKGPSREPDQGNEDGGEVTGGGAPCLLSIYSNIPNSCLVEFSSSTQRVIHNCTVVIVYSLIVASSTCLLLSNSLSLCSRDFLALNLAILSARDVAMSASSLLTLPSTTTWPVVLSVVLLIE